MSLKERLADIARVEGYLLAFDELEADRILGSAGAGRTPGGYGTLSPDNQRAELRRILSDQPREVFERLLAQAPTEELASKFQAISEQLVPLEASLCNLTLAQAGASQRLPWDWDDQPQEQRAETILRILHRQTREVLESLAGLIDEEPAPPPPPPREPAIDPATEPVAAVTSPIDEAGPIFVVHGHDRSILYEASRVLDKATGRDVIILHEQTNAGRTILESFEDHAATASYAVVLLTGDDEGGAKTESDRRLRGRQNVIFELGFFFGKLGRDRVSVLIGSGVEEPSDLGGLRYIRIDGSGAWKHALGRELDGVGIPVDFAKIPAG